MITYVFMTGAGLIFAFGARYGDRAVTQYEPRLAEINPNVSKIFFAAKTVGLTVAAVGLTTAVTAYP